MATNYLTRKVLLKPHGQFLSFYPQRVSLI